MYNRNIENLNVTSEHLQLNAILENGIYIWIK